MVSKITKTIASRVPLDLYFKLKSEADLLGLNMKDYLFKIIEKRKEKQVNMFSEESSVSQKDQLIVPIKKKIKKTIKIETGTNEIIFPK